MIEIRFAQESDRALWMSIDEHLPEGEFSNKARSRQAYLLLEDGAPGRADALQSLLGTACRSARCCMCWRAVAAAALAECMQQHCP